MIGRHAVDVVNLELSVLSAAPLAGRIIPRQDAPPDARPGAAVTPSHGPATWPSSESPESAIFGA